MKKDTAIRIKEKIIEITPKEEWKYLGKEEFVCVGTTSNYSKLVNSKVRENEIGYIIENHIRKRLIIRHPIENLDAKRRRLANFLKDRYPEFLPYWKYGELTDCKEKEIGRLFGCRVTLT